MGTRMAPSYANIFMHRIERKIRRYYPLKPKLWKRYIDDIFMIWQHGETNLRHFLDFINHQHDTIKFTMEYDTNRIPFLDVMVYKKEDKIETTIYNKPTDAPTYLHYSSHHPLKQRQSVPYGLMIRARRICSEETEFLSQAYRIISTLTRVGYPKELLENTLERVKLLDRRQLLNTQEKPVQNETRLITQYNENNPDMRQLMTRHCHLLDETRRPATPSNSLQLTHSRATNLRNILVTSDHPRRATNNGSKPCYKPCASCPLVQTSAHIRSTRTSKRYKINIDSNCQDFNIVYVITCKKCGIQYVGETSRTLNERMRNHESSIRRRDPHPVATHFNLPQHSTRDLLVTIIDRSPKKNERLRLEEAWMMILDTYTPNGLNGRT